METGRIINGWILVAIVLAAIIVTGSIVIWTRYSHNQAVEISIMPDREWQGEIYAGGEVDNPGFYPWEAGDSIEDILRVAGGATDSADLDRIQLYIPDLAGSELPQKVNINQAEAWLLEALPGVGEVRAQAIIDYRRQNGLFRSINELVDVEGFGNATYEKIKHLITVAE